MPLRRIRKMATRPLHRATILAAAVLVVFSGTSYLLLPRAHATTSGQTTLYLKKEPSDINATYNALTLNNSETQSDTASATTSTTNVNVAGGPTSFCESSNNTGETFTQISAAASSTGERCIGTFISPPVGSAIQMCKDSVSPCTGADAASITAQIYSSESSSSQVNSSPNIYIYRWNGSGTTVSAGNLIAKFTTCADPGTTPSICAAAQTAVAPANDITFSATDRIVAIVSQTIIHSHNGQFISNYIDNSTRSPSSSITLGYSFTTPNRPTLSGSLDDDFTTALADTTCSSTTYNSKWNCPGPTASGATTEINSADASGSGGDNSSWLVVRNKCSGCTVSEFGNSPSNAFIYQTLPGDYGSGNVRTVVNSALSYTIGASTPSSPWNHVGLVLWSASGSTPDFLEVQLYSTGVKSSTNTVQVALNNSGTLSGTTNINTSTTAGTYGRIWLGFSNTNGSYQAQYSTDGSTWTNIGSAVAHDAFKQVGLNSFSDINNANYGGAFEWFQSTLAPATYDQTSASWFTNANSAAPGAVHGAANGLAYTLAASGEQVRLRLLLRITGQSNWNNSPPQFKLQYVDKGSGTCAAPSGGTPAAYTDVDATTLIAFYDNAAPADEDNISAATGDPTDGANTVVPQTYQEANNFSASQSDLNYLNDGMWDFSLVDNGAADGSTYCFQVVTAVGAALNSYVYPTLTKPPTTDMLLRGGEYFNDGNKQPFYWAN